MILFIIIILLGLSVGCIGTYLILRPKLKITIQTNEKIKKENEDIESQNQRLQIKQTILQKQIVDEETKYNTISARREEAKKSLNDLKEQSAQAAEEFYESARQLAQSSFDKEIENMSNALDEEREKIKQLYTQTLEESAFAFLQEINEKKVELDKLSTDLEKEQKNVDVAIEAAKRRQKMEDQQDFYRIKLSYDDINEIKRLREVLPYLRDKTPLNKVIYKVYYEKPLSDMIGRVVGAGQHTGIYKITNIDLQKCYVGQAVDIANRWRQHVKRGVGAEDWTRNKLYPAMYELGVENFTFEIVEECERSKLNEREDYWQEFFHAKDYGYSIK